MIPTVATDTSSPAGQRHFPHSARRRRVNPFPRFSSPEASRVLTGHRIRSGLPVASSFMSFRDALADRFTSRVLFPDARTAKMAFGLAVGQDEVGHHADEFIRRSLIHVLPSGFHRIRHYGLFANGARAETSPAPATCSVCHRRRASPATLRPMPTTPPIAAPMPMLRWPHDHHRDLRARLNARTGPPSPIRIDTS